MKALIDRRQKRHEDKKKEKRGKTQKREKKT